MAERAESAEDRSRLRAVASIYERYHSEIEGKFFDETREVKQPALAGHHAATVQRGEEVPRG